MYVCMCKSHKQFVLFSYNDRNAKKRILTIFRFNRTEPRATQLKLHSMFCALFWKITLSAVDVVWPPQISDFTPLDYYVWGAVKDKCYVYKTETIDALNDNILEAIGEIQLHTIDNVLKN